MAAPSTVASAIASPYALIQPCLAAAPSSGGKAEWLATAKRAFGSVFPTEEALQHVPLLTAAAHRAGTIRPNTLVRYFGMVQDTFEPELYPPTVVTSGPTQRVDLCAFRDTLTGDYDVGDPRELQCRWGRTPALILNSLSRNTYVVSFACTCLLILLSSSPPGSPTTWYRRRVRHRGPAPCTPAAKRCPVLTRPRFALKEPLPSGAVMAKWDWAAPLPLLATTMATSLLLLPLEPIRLQAWGHP